VTALGDAWNAEPPPAVAFELCEGADAVRVAVAHDVKVVGVDELVKVVRDSLAAGHSLDEVARALLARNASPIAAIKALREATGMRIGDAKAVVHRNLRASEQEAAEQLWQDLIRAAAYLRGDDGKPSG
jgi:ribosomal protein L7/L12